LFKSTSLLDLYVVGIEIFLSVSNFCYTIEGFHQVTIVFLEELTESFQVMFDDHFFCVLQAFQDFRLSIVEGFLSKRSKSFNYLLILSISSAGFYEIAHFNGLFSPVYFPNKGLCK